MRMRMRMGFKVDNREVWFQSKASSFTGLKLNHCQRPTYASTQKFVVFTFKLLCCYQTSHYSWCCCCCCCITYSSCIPLTWETFSHTLNQKSKFARSVSQFNSFNQPTTTITLHSSSSTISSSSGPISASSTITMLNLPHSLLKQISARLRD